MMQGPIWPNPPIVFFGVWTSLDSPGETKVLVMKSKLEREADGILHAAGFDVNGQPRVGVYAPRQMYGRVRDAWPAVLEQRMRGVPVAVIARSVGLKPHTIAHHLALAECR